MKIKATIFTAALAVSAVSQTALANEFKPGSVRALGMGGSNVASTNNVDASYWNPAAYGFFGKESAVDNNGMADKGFGLELNADVGAYLFGPIAANMTKASALPTTTIGAVGTLTPAGIKDAALLVDGLTSLDPTPGGVNVLAGASLGARVSNYGLGIRSSAEVNASISFDNNNTGLNLFSSFVAAGAPAVPLPVAPQYFTVLQRDQMIGDLQLGANAMTAAQANAVVAAYDASLVGTPTSEQVAMVNALKTLHSAPGDLTKNNTVLSSRGVVISEVGVTYGHSLGDNLSLGTVLKYIQADMIATDVFLLGNNNTNATSFSKTNVETSTGLGIDLGVMYRIPDWQFGLTARNINSPSFEHKASGYVYTLKPQAKVGAAWIPSDTFTIEAGYDITKNTGAVAASESQYWNVGLEWDAFNVVAIRAGAFKNTAQNDIGVVPTLGLGLNLWAARIDLGAAVSSKKVVLEGKSTPVYAMGSLAITIDF